MILQKIKYRENELYADKEMYYRKIDNKFFKTQIVLKNEEEMNFNTYFNSFSVEKWDKYTKLKKIKLRLMLSGKGNITIENNFINGKKLKSNVIKEVTFNNIKKDNIVIDISIVGLKGNISFKIKSSVECIIYDGDFFTDMPKQNNIHLGACICTFKREEYVLKNVNLIKNNILNNKKSELHKYLDVFVIDNAKTLDESKFKGNSIHYIANNNLGGSGGFTRGIIEATFRVEKKITHCILMDDDITLDSDTLYRTFAFLTFLNKKYDKNMIGGAMLLENKRHIQAVSGEKWEKSKTVMRNVNLDLRNEKSIVLNEEEQEINYNGWWYCCIPTKIIKNNNLPLPIFIHMDDVEYGIRNQNGLIVLNGICVWHPSFVNKGPITNTYYNIRNQLIINARYSKNRKCFSKLYLLFLIIYYIIQYKYSEAELAIKAYNDFYLGIDEFKTIDAVKLHSELLSFKYHTISKDLSLDKEMKQPSLIKKLFMCFIGAISYITPKFINEKIYTSNVSLVTGCFVKKMLIYDVKNKNLYTLKIDYHRAHRCLTNYKKMCKLINKCNDEINRNWKNRFNEITNLEFWNRYLDLKNR